MRVESVLPLQSQPNPSTPKNVIISDGYFRNAFMVSHPYASYLLYVHRSAGVRCIVRANFYPVSDGTASDLYELILSRSVIPLAPSR